VSERADIERRLQASEERFRLASEALPGYIYDREGDGTVSRSAGFRRVTGFDPSAVPPTLEWWLQRIHPLDVDDVRSQVAAAFASGAPSFSCEYRIRHKEGHYLWVWDQAVIVRDETGHPVRIVGTVIDITDRKHAESERAALLEREQAARMEAEKANRIKDEFLGTLSHELRTPLSTIRSWAHVLKLNPGDAAQVATAAQVIERNAQLQAQLIGDLLDMSRIAAGKLRLEVQPVDLRGIVQAAMETIRPAAESKSIQFQCVIEPIGDEVHGDPTRLQQVVWNLLSNAIKFTPREGRVRISVARVESHVEVVVADTGMGIAPEQLQTIFERFRQADGAPARRRDGVGLGLAIVKQLVELHGGSVRAHSEGEGKGAVFTVELPLGVASSARVRRTPSIPPDTPRLDGIAVLVVDDRADAAESTARLLGAAGADVSCCMSVDDTLEFLGARDVDVIVTDIVMPMRDGFDLIRAIGAGGRHVPIIALTAFARSEDRTRTLLAGFDAHLAKPADPAELITAVAALHARTRSQRPGGG
jgi:hypothetical protein